MARDGEIDLSYVPTAEMLADCFTKPLPKPAFLKQCAPMGMIGIGLGNSLGNGLGNGFGIGIGKGLGNGLGTLGNSHGMLSELEQASGMLSERKFIGQVCFEEIHVV
jgi:hypothetical protein